jgi:hypothetical protein
MYHSEKIDHMEKTAEAIMKLVSNPRVSDEVLKKQLDTVTSDTFLEDEHQKINDALKQQRPDLYKKLLSTEANRWM